ncbi:MAG: MFS transporter [Ktedonobacterales bacterium]
MTTIVEGTANEAQASTHLWRDGQWLLTLGLVSIVAVTAFEALAVSTILPAVVHDLGGLALYGWVFTAYALTNVIGLVIAGALADEHGPALPFGLGGGCFTAGLLLAGVAPSMAVLIAGRVVQGFGGGILAAVAYVIVARGYQPKARPRMLAMLASAWVIPGLIGPAAASLVAAFLGWRWVFLGLALLVPFAVLLTLPSLRRFTRDRTLPWDWARTRAALLLAVGVGLVLLSATLRPGITAFLALGLGAPAGGVALHQLLPAGTLRGARGLPASIAAMGLVNLAYFGVDAFVPLVLTAVRGQSITVAGLVLTVATLTWTAGAWMQARLVLRIAPAWLIGYGLALIFAAIAGMLVVLLPQIPLAVAFLTWGLGGLGMGIAYSTLSLIVLNHASAQHEGEASSALALTGVLGLALGSGLGGACIAVAEAHRLPISAGLAWQDGMMLLVICTTVWLARRFAEPCTEI